MVLIEKKRAAIFSQENDARGPPQARDTQLGKPTILFFSSSTPPASRRCSYPSPAAVSSFFSSWSSSSRLFAARGSRPRASPCTARAARPRCTNPRIAPAGPSSPAVRGMGTKDPPPRRRGGATLQPTAAAAALRRTGPSARSASASPL
jgi:hypothetical protein